MATARDTYPFGVRDRSRTNEQLPRDAQLPFLHLKLGSCQPDPAPFPDL